MVLLLPLSLEFEVNTTGSAAIDTLGKLSVFLYDLAAATGTGSLAIPVNS